MEEIHNAKFLILKAALDEISELGVGNARTGSIAQRAGVTSGLLHYYFGTKEKLIKAIISHLFDQELTDEIVVIPYHRDCSPVEKIQAILYSILKCNINRTTHNIIKFYHQLMAGEREMLNELSDHYDFFAEQYIISIINEGIRQNYFKIKYPSFFAMDLILTITQQMSLYYALEGRTVQKEFFPEPFPETFSEYFINTSLRKIIIPEKILKIKELDDDLKKIVDTYIDLISRKEVISSWHIVMRLIIKLFNDEHLKTGER